MVERRDDLDLVYECPAGRYLYPTTLVRGQVKRLAAISPHAEKKKKLEKSSQTQLPSCVWRRVARAGFEPLFLSLSLQIIYLTLTLPYLTLPYLTLPMLPLPIEARSKKQEARSIPKKRMHPNSNSTRSRSRSRSLGGAEKPSPKGSSQVPGFAFQKKYDARFYLPTYL